MRRRVFLLFLFLRFCVLVLLRFCFALVFFAFYISFLFILRFSLAICCLLGLEAKACQATPRRTDAIQWSRFAWRQGTGG